MATIDQYLDIAWLACADDPTSGLNPPPLGFSVVDTERGTWYGNGLGGVVCQSETETIIGFSATRGSVSTAPISQSTANARIGLKIVPNMAGAALKLAQRHLGTGRFTTLVGHSLGGALAQVVGAWTGRPFISFNGPGMKTALKLSRINIAHPRQMARSRLFSVDSTTGLCINTAGDFVGNYGTHLGTIVQRVLPRGSRTHSLVSIREALGGDVEREPTYWNGSFGSAVAPMIPTPDLGSMMLPDFSS